MPARANRQQRPNNQAAQVNQEQPNNQPQQDQRTLAEIFESSKISHQSFVNDNISFQGKILEELTKINDKMQTMDTKLDLILDRIPEVEPRCSQSYIYIMNNLHEELTWTQTTEFFKELFSRMNQDNQRNPILKFTRSEMRDRKYFLYKLDIIWDLISPILENVETVEEIKNLVLHPDPHFVKKLKEFDEIVCIDAGIDT